MTLDDGANARLVLTTYTRLWLFPKRLHNLGNIQLSVTGPIPYPALMWGGLFFGVAFFASRWIGIGWTGPELIPRIVIPWLLVRWALSTVSAGARPEELAWVWLRFLWRIHPGFLLGPATLLGLVIVGVQGAVVPTVALALLACWCAGGVAGALTPAGSVRVTSRSRVGQPKAGFKVPASVAHAATICVVGLGGMTVFAAPILAR